MAAPQLKVIQNCSYYLFVSYCYTVILEQAWKNDINRLLAFIFSRESEIIMSTA